jgi:hypothetical protein
MKNKIVLIAFSLNLLLAMTSCSFYAVATIKQNENDQVKKAAAQVFDFPDIKSEETPKTLPKKKQKARQS